MILIMMIIMIVIMVIKKKFSPSSVIHNALEINFRDEKEIKLPKIKNK